MRRTRIGLQGPPMTPREKREAVYCDDCGTSHLPGDHGKCRLCGDPKCKANEHYARARLVEEEEGDRLELELLLED